MSDAQITDFSSDLACDGLSLILDWPSVFETIQPYWVQYF